jgi:hypothetical protein
MNFKNFLIVGLFLAVAAMLLAQDAPKTDTQELGFINYTEGEVFFKNSSISAGDEVYTQKGRAEVNLNGDYVRINEHSNVGFSILEESILLDIRYGEVYIDAENAIEVQTPTERFSLQGLYRIEVDRYKTRKFHNPMLEDEFDKWNYRREKELAGYETPRRSIYREPNFYSDWAWYPYWSWPWIDWNLGWYPVSYYYGYYPYLWQSYWYWTSWNLGWHPYWYWTRGYYYSYYPYYSYYYPYYYGYYYGGPNYYRGQTIVRKNELQRPERTTAPTLIRRSGISNTQLRSNRSIYPSRISSQGLSRGISVRNFEKIYPSRITTRSIKSNSSYRSSPRVSLRSFSEPRYYSRPSISRFSSFPRSFSGPSSRSFSSFRSPSIRSGTIRRR